jgi:hypothetical protein
LSFEILDIILATPLAAMDPESSHQAAASEAAEDSAGSLDTESAIPETLGGSWDPCNLDEETLSSLEQEGLVAAKNISKWRLDPGAASSAPSKKGDCDVKISHRSGPQPSAILLPEEHASALQVTVTPYRSK